MGVTLPPWLASHCTATPDFITRLPKRSARATRMESRMRLRTGPDHPEGGCTVSGTVAAGAPATEVARNTPNTCLAPVAGSTLRASTRCESAARVPSVQ